MLIFLASMSIQAQDLVSGKATLTKIQRGIYDIKISGTIKQIDIRPNVEEHIQGTLSVLFNDCEDLRQSVFQMKEITEDKLISAVKKYNNCNYTPFQPTEKEVTQAANFQGDKFKLFAKLGMSINRTSFFDSNEYQNQTQGQIGFGIAATPGFLGSLQGNLYFTMEVEAAFSGDKEFNNSPFAANFKKNSYKANLGTEFHFNKKGIFQPLIGIGVGLTRDHYNGSYDSYKIKETVGSAFVNPKIGVLFPLDEKKSLGLIMSYIPKYTNDLSFFNQDREVIPLTIDTYYINAGLCLYF